MVTKSASLAIQVVIHAEERHARAAMARLSTASGVYRRGELASTYHWRQARRHLMKAARAREALALIGG